MKRGYRFVCLGFLCILLGFGLVGCMTATENAQAKPELVIGGTLCEPYFYKNVRGEYVGIDVEIARQACERAGYEPVFVEIEIGERFSDLENGKVDCLWSALTMDGREDDFLWAGPYLYAQRVAVVHADSEYNTLADLEDKRVSVQAGSTSEGIIVAGLNPNFPRLRQLTVLGEVGEVFAALRKGYVDAAAGMEGALQIYMEEYPGEYRCLNMSLRSEAMGVAFRKDADTQLVQKLDQALKEMLDDGTTATIIEQYGLDVEKNVYGGQIDADAEAD